MWGLQGLPDCSTGFQAKFTILAVWRTVQCFPLSRIQGQGGSRVDMHLICRC